MSDPRVDAVEQALGEDLLPLLEQAHRDVVWLTLAVLRGQLPTEAEVERYRRRVRLDGATAVLPGLLEGSAPAVEVLTGQVLVDVHASAGGDPQAVGYRLAEAWQREHDPVLVAWADERAALQRVDLATGARGGLLVPWRCRYLLPEQVGAHRYTTALSSLLRWSGTTGGLVGAGCGPLVAGEDEPAAAREAFVSGMGAAAHADRIAATSPSAEQEYAGWRAMLAGAGLVGPEVRVVDLGDPLPADEVAGRRVTVHAPVYDPLGETVARSLLAGIPVITSRFGACRDVAGTDGGALLVDPRSEAEVAEALRQVLTDDALHSRLEAQARARPRRPWEDYAEQVWTYLVTQA